MALASTGLDRLKRNRVKEDANRPMEDTVKNLHIICERDVGLFSLIQQVIANIPWAMAEGRTPIAYFSNRCAYFTPRGFNNRDTVWEYYFEPLLADFPAAAIPTSLRDAIDSDFFQNAAVYQILDNNVLVTNQFGDHRSLRGKALAIPYRWHDPDDKLRATTSEIVRQHVRPRASIERKVQAFYERHMDGRNTIGVHARGTDVISAVELHAHRQGSLVLENFAERICELSNSLPDAIVFVATDDQNTLNRLTDIFGERIVAHDSLRHQGGVMAGLGPTGQQMPGYIADDTEKAARNGEEAVVEYLLLCRCQHLVHNGGGLARTVLLANPDLAHSNVHLRHTPLTSRFGAEVRLFGRRVWRGIRRLPGKPRRIAAKIARRKAVSQQLPRL